MVELPKTEAELQAYVDDKVKEATKDTISKGEFDSKFANQRKTYEDKIKQLEDKIGITAEQKAKELAEQKQKELDEELNSLRTFKKEKLLEERLTKEKLPSHYKYDTRLINATDDEFENALKCIKKEYEDNLPKGNTHSTVVPTSTSTPSAKDNKGLEGMAEAIKNMIS